MSLSNVSLLSNLTGYSELAIGEIINYNKVYKKRYSTLVANYRNALKSGKGIQKNKNSIEKHLLNDSYITLYSPRHKSSVFIGNVVQLNEDGIYNLRALRYLLDRHNFLVSGAFALLVGLRNSNSAKSVLSSEFKASKIDMLNSVPRRLSKIRLVTFLKSELEKFNHDKKYLDEILEKIEL